MEPHIISDEESGVTDESENETDLALSARTALLEARLLELKSQKIQQIIRLRKLVRETNLLQSLNYALRTKLYHQEQLNMLQDELNNQLKQELMMLRQQAQATADLAASDQPVSIPDLATTDSHAVIRHPDQDLEERRGD